MYLQQLREAEIESALGEEGSRYLEAGGKEKGGTDFSTGMTVGGGRKQCICQLVLPRLQIVTRYRLISVPSAVTEREVQRKTLSRCEDIQEVHLANHNRSNSASYHGLSQRIRLIKHGHLPQARRKET